MAGTIRLFGKDLGKEELKVGAVYSAIFIPWLAWWTLALAPVISFLWGYGGADNTSKVWRRVGVPLVCSLALGIITGNWIAASIGACAGWGVLSIGYGIPDSSDDGSTLGKFIFNLFNAKLDDPEDGHYVTVVVRSILYVLFGACYHATFMIMT